MKPLFLAAALLTASPAMATTWTMQPDKSTLGFSGTQSGASFTGKFSQWRAQIFYDPAQPKRAIVHITVQTASAQTGNPQYDSSLPGSDWFAAAKFPQAVFIATGFSPQGGDKFTTTGILTMRGISKTLTLPFTLDISGKTATAHGAITLDRANYGVGQGNWSTGSTIGLNVTVNFTLVATQN